MMMLMGVLFGVFVFYLAKGLDNPYSKGVIPSLRG